MDSVNGQVPTLFDSEHPLRPIIAEWIAKIRLAEQHKKKQFGDAAEECMKFYNGGAMDLLYGTADLKKGSAFRRDTESDWPAPTFQMQANKLNEVVALFGPVLYFKEPYRQVSPRKQPEIPPEVFTAFLAPTPQTLLMGPDMGQQQLAMATAQLYQQEADRQNMLDKTRGLLLQWILNYTQRELRFKDDARLTIDEALIKGMGCVWQEVVTPKNGPRMIGSFFDSVDYLQIDPDVERLEDAQWIARKCIHPVWQVERDYNLPRGSLKASMESYHRQSSLTSDNDNADYDRKRGLTNDLLVYWKVWSKMGVGGRLTGVDKRFRDVLDQFGDNAYLVIAPDIPYPLNLPSEKLAGPPDEALKALDWPIPFWIDGKWPMVPLYFRTVPRQLWPMAHFSPAMGYLKALNWLYSMMISKVGITCRDFIACLKSASQEVKDAILHGRDFTFIEVPTTGPQSINDIVGFLRHPEMQADVWKVLESVKQEFEKATGLSELVYGMSSRQMRSAQEATLKGDQISVRPDDMANKVEDWASSVARNEAVAVGWLIGQADVEPLMGKPCAVLWQALIVSADPVMMIRSLECGIEAGSTMKPNKDRDAANMQQAMQNLFQPFFMVAQSTAFVKPVNALITDWCKSLDLDWKNYLFPDLPPPMPQVAPGGPPGQQQEPGKAANGDAAQAAPPPPQGQFAVGAAAPQVPGQMPLTVGMA